MNLGALSRSGSPLVRTAGVAALCAASLAGTAPARAAAGQTPPTHLPGAPAGSYPTSDLEQINLFSGNMLLRLRLRDVNGRGESGTTVNLPIEWHWRVEPGDGQTWTPAFNWWRNTKPGYGPGSMAYYRDGSPGSPPQLLTRLVFTSGDGTEYELRDAIHDGAPQNNTPITDRGRQWRTQDGTAATYLADLGAEIKDVGDVVLNGFFMLRDGTRHRIDNGEVSWTRDRNGNKTSYEYVQLADFHGVKRGRQVATITDSLHRVISFEYASSGNPPDPPKATASDVITFQGFGGADRTIVVTYSFLEAALAPGETKSPYGGGCAQPGLFPTFPWGQPCLFHNPIVVHNVEIPDQRHYQFRYNRYAELKSVDLPTGGKMEYEFGTFDTPVFGGIYRRLTKRTVKADGVNKSQVTKYGTPVLIEDFSPPNGNQMVSVDEVDPAAEATVLRRTAHYFYGQANSGLVLEPTQYPHWKIGREYKTEVFEGASQRLRTVEHTWDQLVPPPLPPTSHKSYNPRITQTKTTLDNSQFALRSFTYDAYNNVTSVEETDYGTTVTPPPALLRRAATTYVTTIGTVDYAGALVTTPLPNLDIHIRNLPSIVKRFSWNGSTWVQQSQTDYKYDEYSGGHNAALKPYPAGTVTGTFPNFLDGSWPYRGNATRVSRKIDGGTATVDTYAHYDVLGSVVKVLDARLKETTFEFDDNFGEPDEDLNANDSPSQIGGLQTYAFVTTTTNDDGHQILRQYDYDLGVVTDEQDPNGTVTTTFHGGELDRPIRVVMANTQGAPERSRVEFEYRDFNGVNISENVVITKRDRNNYEDGLEQSEVEFDGIGREIETRVLEDAIYAPEGTITFVEKRYDGLGRLAKVSNPRRNGLPEWTTTTFDALDRPVRVETPDGAASTSTYAGSITNLQDPAAKKREQTQDGLGRVVKVVEDPTTANYATYYSYNALDNLTAASQGEGAPCPAVVAGRQCRMFTYDWLGRLTAETVPEVVPTSQVPVSARYVYDGNGNLTQKVDPRVTVDYTYDDLNRLKTRSYTGVSTPAVTYTYDSPMVPYSRGRLTQVSNSVSTTDYRSYDRLGRIKQSRQTTESTAYDFSYDYDLAGNRTFTTYPSGRTVKTGWDRASRVASVQQMAPVILDPFAWKAQYAPHGAIRQLQLGNGLWESTTLFNSRLQPRVLGLGSMVNDLGLLSLEYTYGGSTNNGNVMSQQIQFPGQAAPISQTYTYDGVNRLGSATEGSVVQTYGYNRFGNRWVVPPSFIPNPALTPTAEGAFDNQTNRLSLPNLYDASGNHTRDTSSAVHFFTYNGDNLQATYDLSDPPTANRVSYEYDGEGRRIRRSQAGAFRIFVYDAYGQLAAEYTSGASNVGTGIAYMTRDTLGSVRIVTNGSGAVLARHDFLPFGEELPSTGTGGVRPTGAGYGGTDGVRHRFTGKERDNENGLDYLGARYFSGAHGRFTSTDPLLNSGRPDDPQTWNRYAYVTNNPLRYTDPFGLYQWATSCEEVEGSTCKEQRDRFRTALDDLKGAASALEKGSKERKNLEGVIKRIGGEGEGSARVAFGAVDKALGLATGNKMTLDFPAVDKVVAGFKMTGSEKAALDAGLVAHEGRHLGRTSVFPIKFMTMRREHAALYSESATYQGLHNSDRAFSLWNESWLLVDRKQLEQRREVAIQNELERQKQMKDKQ
jgi:RHS repeat-associated protein